MTMNPELFLDGNFLVPGIPEDHPYREFVELCDMVLHQCRRFSQATMWTPTAQSPQQALAAQFADERGSDGAWGETPYAKYAADLCYVHLAAASMHFKSIRTLLAVGDVRMSLAVLARCIFELEGKVRWLLADDLDVRARGARIALSLLKEISRGSELARRPDGNPPTQPGEASLTKVRETIRSQFLPEQIRNIDHPDSRKWKLQGQELPSLSGSVKGIGETTDEQTWFADAYDELSSVTHPTISTFLRVLGLGPEQPVAGLIPDAAAGQVDPNEVRAVVEFAQERYCSIWRALADYDGLDTTLYMPAESAH